MPGLYCPAERTDSLCYVAARTGVGACLPVRAVSYKYRSVCDTWDPFPGATKDICGEQVECM